MTWEMQAGWYEGFFGCLKAEDGRFTPRFASPDQVRRWVKEHYPEFVEATRSREWYR